MPALEEVRWFYPSGWKEDHVSTKIHLRLAGHTETLCGRVPSRSVQVYTKPATGDVCSRCMQRRRTEEIDADR